MAMSEPFPSLSDVSTFGQAVRDALHHFHDLAYLRAHPLARVLRIGDGSRHGAQVQQVLRDAIAELKPTTPDRPDIPAWRGYHYLIRRYVEWEAHADIARTLGISDRQAHRDQQRAERALIDLLWLRYQPDAPEAGHAADAAVPPADSPLDAELRRIGASPRPCDLADLLRTALETVAGMAAVRRVQIETTDVARLPLAMVDPDMLRQVLLAVLSYALESGEHGRVEIRGDDDDTSIGLAFRITPAATPGLSPGAEDRRIEVGRRLLEPQGGTLRLIPRQDGTIAALRVEVPRVRPTTVLLVDDDPDFVQLLQRYLRGHPYAVLQANNASRAIEIARDTRPDLVLLDVMMPSQDGWEILSRLRQLDETRDTPVVICSVLGDAALADALGATAVLAKPVTQRSLLELLEQHTHLRAGHPASL